ncbi:MAG TPA: rhomboid family intramembrane serine protease [Dysgonamonadaceae bacterium]|nr:rhomboid family intramembrane serine protease [Dysgonamonadaceae bacterium]
MITITIIILTSLISYQAFRDYNIADKLIFQPAAVRDGEWYRLLTYGVLHANLTHLIFNMFTFYLFGSSIEGYFKAVLGTNPGSIAFIILYIGGLLFSILPTYIKQKDNYYYKGLGASGAVSAVVFAYILINPMNFMGIMFIPIMLPAFLFGFIFILISMYLDKNQVGGINHSAHITGGLFGVILTTVMFLVLNDTNLLLSFIHKVQITSLSQLIYFGF